MATNSLYPSFIKLFYNSAGHPHVQTLPVKAFSSLSPSGWGLEKPISPAQYADWEDGVDAYVTVLKTWFPAASAVNSAELWTMADPTADPIYRATMYIGVAGTNATAALLYAQNTMTFRTDAGGIYKSVVLEMSATSVNTEVYPPFSGIQLAMSNFLTGVDSFVFGRDGGRIIAPIRSLAKTNDALRKKYLLDA